MKPPQELSSGYLFGGRRDAPASAAFGAAGAILLVLAQDAQRLVERLNLLLAVGHAVVVRHPSVDASRLEVQQLLQGTLQLVACGDKQRVGVLILVHHLLLLPALL